MSARRDHRDETRDYGATHDPAETLVLDTTDLTETEQVDHIVKWAKERGA